jgi:hypothetical protein
MLIFLRKEKNILLTFESGQYFVMSLGPSVKIFPPLHEFISYHILLSPNGMKTHLSE